MRPQRKPSILGMTSQPRLGHLTPSDGMRPSTPMSFRSPGSQHERHHNGLLNFFGKSYKPEAQPQMLTPPATSPAMTVSPIIIPRSTKAFVDALTFTQLSNFLTWMLCYEVVQLPEGPEIWYSQVDNMEIRGWIALGEFLGKSQEAGAGYGYDLIVLDSICDRMRIPRRIVHTLLIRFSHPDKMKYSILASQEDDATTMVALEAAQSKLHDLYKLATRLKPQQGSRYEERPAII